MNIQTIKNWIIAAAAILVYSFICGLLDGVK